MRCRNRRSRRCCKGPTRWFFYAANGWRWTARDISTERVDDASQHLKVGDKIEARFMGMDRKGRTLQLSIKAKEIHEEAEAVQNYRTGETSSGTSLGDLLKEHIGGGDN